MGIAGLEGDRNCYYLVDIRTGNFFRDVTTDLFQYYLLLKDQCGKEV